MLILAISEVAMIHPIFPLFSHIHSFFMTLLLSKYGYVWFYGLFNLEDFSKRITQ